MALLSPKMSLRLWEQLQDPYNHDQLADNFSKLDFHDHTPGRGNQIPTEGLFDGSVNGVKMDPNVLSPWRNVMWGVGFLTAAQVAAVYGFGHTSGVVSGGSWSSTLPFEHIDPADFAITGRTTQFRIKASLYTNATAPAANFTFGLYPLGTLGGGAGAITSTLGAVVSGTTGVFTAPTASSPFFASSSGFTLASAGHYYLGVATSATIATSSHVGIKMLLQVHNV
jgi:hypothetical protein